MNLDLSYAVERTARELAKRAKCSLPTVYRRLAALRAAGVNISERRVRRTGTPGVVPLRYKLEGAP